MLIDHARGYTAFFLLTGMLWGCNQAETGNTSIREVAANEDVAGFMKDFEGRGALTDDSRPMSPRDALGAFDLADDLAVDLVLSEPEVTQPVFLNFDHRGRLWVAQYNQYPYPKGLRVLGMDQHLRATFDKVPEPPPSGEKGADKLTFFEDTDGDGTFDKHTDAITGLNIATSVTLGRQKIWVLDPPFLLAYPDPDQDGLPDGTPEVHLRGFGLEDTHAVANSLRWGPDGWLYGAQGSTCTASVSSSVTKDVRFNGQAIWRYHPETRVFEIFAEGGGNTFYVEIDEKGRFYSGHNGIERGQYYKQGGYYPKNWDKHGAHTNPYSFGYLDHMALEGDKRRFTHAFIKYEGASLPPRYHGHMIALNPLHSYVQLTRFEAHGSTFLNVDETQILSTNDKWFRPVDLKTGPDGAVYIADWYDSRLSHIDPRDTWHKGSGRIYRLRNKSAGAPLPPFDLSTYTTEQLIPLLAHGNIWFRQQALVQFGNRSDKSVIPKLKILLDAGAAQTALEALWAIHLSGGFDEEIAVAAMRHSDAFVRMWAVRLTGDLAVVPDVVFQELVRMAGEEPHPEVRSQLAATAKRLPGTHTMGIVQNLLTRHDDSGDPDIPMQLWWALESKAESDRAAVLEMFRDRSVWTRGIVTNVILKALMKRYIMAGGGENFESATRLISLAPEKTHGKILLQGLQEGLKGKGSLVLPGALLKAVAPYKADFGGELLTIAVRQGDKQALERMLAEIFSNRVETPVRVAYISLLGEVHRPESVGTLLQVVEGRQFSDTLRQAAMLTLQRYSLPGIGARVIAAYHTDLRDNEKLRTAALELLASRTVWAIGLLNAMGGEGRIGKEEIPDQIVRRLLLLNDPEVTRDATRLWPWVKDGVSPDKNERIKEVAALYASGRGTPERGRAIYRKRCGSCHRLFDEGGATGPDLTGYDRSNLNELLVNVIDPSAYIREGYVVHHVTTADGRSLAGMVRDQNGDNVTLETFNGEKITLGGSQVVAMTAQKTSLMPERLLDGLTDQEIRDLLAYIMKAQ